MEIVSNSSLNAEEKKTSVKFASSSKLESSYSYIPEDWNFSKQSLKVDWSVGEIKSWRRAENEDVEAIQGLMNVNTDNLNSLYNNPEIDYLIEKSYFPIVQLDGRGRVVSFTAYAYYPNVPSIPAYCWVDWIHELYKLADANPRNSLFIHYMVWHPKQKNEFLRLLLETSFLEFTHLRYIIFVKPPLTQIPEIYAEYFIPLLPFNLRDHENGIYTLQSINICHRHAVIERLHIRKATAEDSDILMYLFKSKHMYYFNKLYGEFFFAELTEFPGAPDRHLLVCEYEGDAAGVMCISSSVDLDFLNDEFELIPFHGLRKMDDCDVISDILSLESMNIDSDVFNKIDMLRPQDIDPLALDELNLETPVVELKKIESSSSSESIYEVDFPMLNVWSSLQNLTTDAEVITASESSESQRNFVITSGTINADVPELGEIQVRRHQRRVSTASMQKLFFPRYNGAPNAFVIELFAVDNDKIDERLSTDFLEAAFSLLPDRDYCVITIPTHLYPPPLLSHFIRANRRPMKQSRHELYICHRSYLSSSSVVVRTLEMSDLDYVKPFLHKVYNSDVICVDFQDSFQPGTAAQSFAMFAETKIIGIALIRFETGLEYLPLNFDISDFSVMDFHSLENRSVLRHLLLGPPFHNFGRFFLVEIMRLADVTCLFHPYYHETKLNGNVLSILGELVPIKPRKTIRFYSSAKASNAKSFLNLNMPFSLFFTNSRLCSGIKTTVNKIIVVIGASVTAFSFFENFLFGPAQSQICYSNLIWVSEHGTGQELPANQVRDLMFPIKNKYDKHYRAMLSLKTHVHFIYGVMTAINRDEKYVVINGENVVKYDILILTVGLQFLKIFPEVRRKKDTCSRSKFTKSSLSRFLTKHANITDGLNKCDAVNMFTINTYLEADIVLLALECVKNKMKSGVTLERKIIIYGHNIRVFLLMQALLKLGIPGSMIAFVEPFPNSETSVTVFGDISIDSEVIKSIKRCEIQYYPGHFFYDWNFASTNRIENITFHSHNAQVTLQCLVFIPMNQKLVSEVNFNACNNAGLVYDGKLVINGNFKTNDQNIFAAGPFTKYSRRCFAPGQAHRYYSSVEVGEKLADFIRQEINYFTVKENAHYYESDSIEKTSITEGQLPMFIKPVMVYCQLPGDFFYFSLQKPGKPIDVESGFNQGDFGDILTTGDCKMTKGNGYFRLHLDQAGCIQGILCFTKKEIDYMNLYSLYGLHEKLLNNLLIRYDCEMITDFYEYFSEPWTEAIFHHEFPRLAQYNMNLFKKEKPVKKNQALIDLVASYLVENKWQTLSEPVRTKVELEYQSSVVRTHIERTLLDFLNFFEKELTKYATPRIVENLFLRDSTSLQKKDTDDERD